MANLKTIFGFGRTTAVGSSVEVSDNGTLSVDPSKLMQSERVHEQIAAFDKLVREGRISIEKTPGSS